MSNYKIFKIKFCGYTEKKDEKGKKLNINVKKTLKGKQILTKSITSHMK